MHYLSLLPSLILGTDSLFSPSSVEKSRPVAIINIIILGMLFGVSNLLGILSGGEVPQLDTGAMALLVVLLLCYGIVTMCAALIGLCLIYWAAAKALGGQGGLMRILETLGLAAVPFWLLVPLLNYQLRYAAGTTASVVLILPLGMSFCWSFMVLRKSMTVGQGLSDTKATLAVAMMWIFGVSAVYVFIP